MGRSFPFMYCGRSLSISALAIDEGWELWVLEGHRKVACAGRLSVDEAIDAGRRGEDRISALAEEMKTNILLARLPLRLEAHL